MDPNRQDVIMPRLRYLLILALAACSSTTAPASDNDGLIREPVEVTLAYGQVKQIEGSVLSLGFADVLHDSRCPVDVVCIWEGNAAVVVTIAAGKGPSYSLTLNTALEPQFADWFSVRVTLLEVTPAPLAGQPIPPESYAIRLRVEPLPASSLSGTG